MRCRAEKRIIIIMGLSSLRSNLSYYNNQVAFWQNNASLHSEQISGYDAVPAVQMLIDGLGSRTSRSWAGRPATSRCGAIWSRRATIRSRAR